MIENPLRGSQWIGSPNFGGPRTSEPPPHFRKEFHLDSPAKRATLYVTALGVYECEINGQRIGDDVFAPGWTDYHKTVYFQTFEIEPLLKVGDNAIGAILGEGWYCGYIAWENRQGYGDRPKLLLRLVIELADGSHQEVVSDTSWKTRTGPILEAGFLMGEAYDARRELGAWSHPSYDESAWQSVEILKLGSDPQLLPQIGPSIRRMGEIKPIAVHKIAYWRGPIFIYDLGQNFAGRVRIKVRAAEGRTVRLRHAEMLNPDGGIFTENLRQARADDSYVCVGNDEESWEPRFTFHGFRYVEVTGLLRDDFFELVGIVLHSDMGETGHFACSNPLLNQLQSNILWSQKSNFLDVPTDCPQRDERLGWTGDAQVFIRTACFNMDGQAFFRKWMQDVRDGQQPNGAIPCVIPHINIHKVFDDDGGPAWSDATIICPWTIYLCYGDIMILKEHYSSMQRYHEFLLKHRCIGLIRSHPDIEGWLGYGDWLALDGSGDDRGSTPPDLIGTAFLAFITELLARIARILGQDEDGQRYSNLHHEIRDAFRDRFIGPDGLMLSKTQTSTVLALQFNLLTENSRAAAAEELISLIEKNAWHLGTGFVGTPYLLGVLEESGHLETAYRLLEQETFPSWLFPVKNGATTIWERWDAWTVENGFQNPSMNSFNHYAYGAVGAWMYSRVAGIELDLENPGYRHIIFRPRPGGTLTWAEGRLKLKAGYVGIRWEMKEDMLSLSLTVPIGSCATLDLPEGYLLEPANQRLEPGNYTFTAVRQQ